MNSKIDDVRARDESYRNGFDHGRRWAAEELLRIAARENRLQSSWLWHQLGESKLTEFAAELRATLRPGTVDRAITVQAAARIAEGGDTDG